MSEKNKLRATRLMIVIALVVSFFLGRAWGFEEASDAYEPVIEKSQTLIDELEHEIEVLYSYFEGVKMPAKAEITAA